MPQTGPLERSVMRSVRASNHIAAADAATVELARALAREIDADSSRAWRYGSQFIEVLRQLRLTPKERRALPDAPPAVEPDPLAVLRERLANRGSRE